MNARRSGDVRVFEEIMMNNFEIWQENKFTKFRRQANVKKNKHKEVQVKVDQNLKYEIERQKKILKADRDKDVPPINELQFKRQQISYLKSWRPEGVAHFSCAERKEPSRKDFYPVELTFRNQGEINIFLEKGTLRTNICL